MPKTIKKASGVRKKRKIIEKYNDWLKINQKKQKTNHAKFNTKNF